MLDFNDAEPQMGPMGELFPDGTFVKLKMKIRPGGVDGPVPADKGLLRAAKNSDAKLLDCEFVALSPRMFARKHMWQDFTVAGGKPDKDGQSLGWKISKSFFRAMIESAAGIDPKDMTDEAQTKRKIQALSKLNGIEFAARIMIEPGNDGYRDKNRIANIVLKGDPQYDAVMRGDYVVPDPINAQPKKAKNAAQSAPAWGGEGTGSNPSGQNNSWGGQPQPTQAGPEQPSWLS